MPRAAPRGIRTRNIGGSRGEGGIAAARGTAPSINRVFAIPRASFAKLRPRDRKTER